MATSGSSPSVGLAALRRVTRWYGKAFAAGMELARKSQEHGDQIVIWTTGLMGAGLLALPAFLTATCGPGRMSLARPASPWAFGVIVALLARALAGLRRDAEDTYNARKRTQIDGLLLTQLEASANPSEVSPALFAAFRESLRIIMNDEDATVSKLAKKARCLHRVAEGAYYLSLLAFAVGVAAVWWVMRQCPRPIP